MIDRSFYAYTNEDISAKTFQERFSIFQGTNKNVNVEFVSSNFMQQTLKLGEMETLQAIFEREQRGSTTTPPFNVAVDLCGVFKLTTIYDVRALILKHFGPDCFHYIYHIDQIDGSDRMLCIRTNNDVAFDEEFYKHLCRTYGSSLSSKVFFFVDNRNYIGKTSAPNCLHKFKYSVLTAVLSFFRQGRPIPAWISTTVPATSIHQKCRHCP